MSIVYTKHKSDLDVEKSFCSLEYCYSKCFQTKQNCLKMSPGARLFFFWGGATECPWCDNLVGNNDKSRHLSLWSIRCQLFSNINKNQRIDLYEDFVFAPCMQSLWRFHRSLFFLKNPLRFISGFTHKKKAWVKWLEWQGHTYLYLI